MKYSQVLASALFGSMAAAIPFKRDLITKTEVAIETVVVYTTVWEDDLPVAEATTTAGGYFYEQPAAASTTPAAVSTPAFTSAYTPSPVQEPSSVYTPPVETPAAPSSAAPVVVSSAAPAPEPVVESSAPAPAAPTTTEAAYTPAPAPTTSEAAYTPAPAPTTEAAPAPTSEAAPAPAPAATSAAAAPQQASSESSGSVSTGESFGQVDLTINPVKGDLGACGEPMNPEDLTVALAKSAWGESTYDVMTGKATNKWCGQKIQIQYGGKSVVATIMDMCPGCAGHDIDLSDGAWAAIGMTELTRVKGSWSIVN